MEMIQELRRLREAANLSQSQLARESKVDRATLNKIEQGKRSPTIETLEKLAETLDVEVADFFPKAQAQLPLEKTKAELAEESESSKYEERPVWVRALRVDDYNVEKLILLSPEGEQLWDWLIFAEDVDYVERAENDE